MSLNTLSWLKSIQMRQFSVYTPEENPGTKLAAFDPRANAIAAPAVKSNVAAGVARAVHHPRSWSEIHSKPVLDPCDEQYVPTTTPDWDTT